MASGGKEIVAISGANGFVGSHIVRKFLAEGHSVKPLIRKNADTSLLPAGIECTNVDYDEIESIENAIYGAEIVIHNAGITRTKNRETFIKHNVGLTANILEAVNQTESVKRFLFVSSQAAGGACKDPKKESDECCPVSHYGESKLQAELMIKERCQKDWTIVRPCSVYGEGDRDFLQYFKLAKTGVAVISGLRKKMISLIYVEQLCDYIFAAATEPNAMRETFFLSDGKSYSWDDFICALEEAIGRKTVRLQLPEILIICVAATMEVFGKLTKTVPLINWQKSKEIRAYHWVCDNSKSQKLLNVTIQGALKDNLRKTYEWYKEKLWL